MYISINTKSRHGPYNNIIDMHIVAIHRELHVWVCILLRACIIYYMIPNLPQYFLTGTFQLDSFFHAGKFFLFLYN